MKIKDYKQATKKLNAFCFDVRVEFVRRGEYWLAVKNLSIENMEWFLKCAKRIIDL